MVEKLIRLLLFLFLSASPLLIAGCSSKAPSDKVLEAVRALQEDLQARGFASIKKILKVREKGWSDFLISGSLKKEELKGFCEMLEQIKIRDFSSSGILELNFDNSGQSVAFKISVRISQGSESDRLISKSELENLSLALSLTKGTTGIVLRFISPQRTRVDLGVEGSIKSIQNFWKTIKRVPSVKSVCLSKLHRWNGETGEFIFSVIPAKFKDQSKESFQNAKAKIMDYSFIYAGTLLNIAKSSQVKLVRFSLGNFVVGSKGVETFSTIEMHGSSKTLAKALMKISLFSGKEFFSIPRKLLAVPLKNIPANSSDNVKLELEVQQFAPFGKNSFSFPSLNLKAISHLLFYGGLAFNNSSGIAAKKGQINILRLFVLPTSEGAIVGFMDNVDQAESLQAFLKKEPEFFAHSYLKESHDFSSSEQYGATELEINNGQPKYKLEIEFTKEKSP